MTEKELKELELLIISLDETLKKYKEKYKKETGHEYEYKRFK